MPEFEPLSPQWWVKRLYRQILAQDAYFTRMNSYYLGEPAHYPWLAVQAREEFSRLLSLTKSNYMGLVVDATAERISVEGFRIGTTRSADKPTWDIWQANRLDSGSDQAILEAVIGGRSYLLVAPNEADPGTPLVYVEHMSQATVEYVPGTARRHRAAGLKVWHDDWTDQVMATLYLSDRIYKFQAPSRNSAVLAEPRWERREVRKESWPAPNPMGEVPLVELSNNPRLLTGGVSEIEDVTAVQDRICKTLVDRLMTQDFGAFPQKWATGFPDEDANGTPTRIDVGRNRMITSDAVETEFGQWAAASLDPYSAAKREDVKDIASRTKIPAQYLLGEMSNVNGETLKAAESGLVSKTKQRCRGYGEDLEEAVNLIRRTAGLTAVRETIEVIWRNPEFRTEGELVDALTKMATLGVPRAALWERWGASQPEIERWQAMAVNEAAIDPVGRMTSILGRADADNQ